MREQEQSRRECDAPWRGKPGGSGLRRHRGEDLCVCRGAYLGADVANTEVTTTPSATRIRPTQRRTWEDQIAVRSPRAYRLLAWAMWRVFQALRRGHPVRRAIAKRVASRSYGAFNRNDLDALLALYHPECLWDWSHFVGWPDDPFFRGPEGLRRGWLFFREAWGKFEVTPSEIRDCGDKLMATCHMRATGGASGVGLAATWWQVGELRDGLITLVANYSDHREALKAADLCD